MVDEVAAIGEVRDTPVRNYADVEDFLYQRQGYYRKQSEDTSLAPATRTQARREYNRTHAVVEKMEEVTDLRAWRAYSPAVEAVQNFVDETYGHIIRSEKEKPAPNLEKIRFHQETQSLLNQSIKNSDFKIPTTRGSK